MSELSRLADQYVAVHLSDRAEKGSQNQKGNQFVQKTGQNKFPLQKGSFKQSQEAGNKPPGGNVQQNASNQDKSGPAGFRSLSSVTTVRNPVISWLTVA